MRLIKRTGYQKHGVVLVLEVEHADDLWCLYNLISKGDKVEAFTSRRIKIENKAGAVVGSEIKKFKLTIEVEKITYTSAYDDLQINGRNASDNEYVKIGQYHTLDVHPKSVVTLHKHCWSFYFQQKLDESVQVQNQSDQAFLVMDVGTAQLHLHLRFITKQVFSISKSIPKKKQSAFGKPTSTDRATQTFFKDTLARLDNALNLETIQSLVIVGPGSAKDEFLTFLKSQSLSLGYAKVHKSLGKFISCSSTSSDVSAIAEVLADEKIAKQIGLIHFDEHNKALLQLKAKLQEESDLTAFGIEGVQKASDYAAIDVLMICDELFREADATRRTQLCAIVDACKQLRCKILFLSEQHPESKLVTDLGGIAAILKFSIAQDED